MDCCSPRWSLKSTTVISRNLMESAENGASGRIAHGSGVGWRQFTAEGSVLDAPSVEAASRRRWPPSIASSGFGQEAAYFA